MRIHHIGSTETIVYHKPDSFDASIKFVIQDHSVVSIVILYAQDLQALAHVYEFLIGSSCQVNIFFAFMQGQDLAVSCDIIMQGQQSYANLYGIYALSADQKLHFATKQMHVVPYCSTVVRLQGVVQNFAECVYAGLIYVDQKASHTFADQQHQNLMLSDTSRVCTDPHIQVYTNEVMCSHGAASSGFDEEQLYSLQTRGLEKKQAEKLMLEAFLNNVLIYFPKSESIMNQIILKVAL